MIKKLNGIVVSETNYSETSKILNILTKEHGVIGVISKGSRKIKSPLRSVSTKLSYGEVNLYYKKDKLSNLISIDINNSFNNIRKDITKISYASYLMDLTVQIARSDFNEKLFDNFINGLIKINDGFDPAVIVNILELKYLDYLGIKPEIDACVSCFSKAEIFNISIEKGGLLCRGCNEEEVLFSDDVIKLIRMFYYVDIEKIEKLNINEKNKYEINKFLSMYYDKYTGLYLKSKKMLEELKKLT